MASPRQKKALLAASIFARGRCRMYLNNTLQRFPYTTAIGKVIKVKITDTDKANPLIIQYLLETTGDAYCPYPFRVFEKDGEMYAKYLGWLWERTITHD